MPMIAIFGAEILAAEAAAVAAAEIAAAEAAAAAAAEIAATEAAAAAAAEAALQQTAQQATQAGIMEVGGATANPALTAEAVQNAAMQSGMPPPAPPADPAFTAKGSLNLDSGRFINTTLPEFATQPAVEATKAAANVTTSPVANFQPTPGFEGTISGPQGADPGFFNSSAAPGQGPMQYQLNAPNASQSLRLGGTGLEGIPPSGPMTSVLQPPSALENGFTKAMEFADKNPFKASAIAYTGASALGLLDPSNSTFNQEKYDGPLTKYKLSPNFQAGSANPANFQYKPRYAAGGILDAMGGGGSGGISADGNLDLHIPIGFGNNNNNVGGYQNVGASNMSPSATNNSAPQQMFGANNNIDVGGNKSISSYARGGSLSSSIEQYQKMLEGKPQAAPAKSADVGIYYDQDPDTRYQDALTAAQIRQAKVNQRAYVSPPAAKRPEPLGRLNMPTSAKSKGSGDVEAAHGGIMHSSLGGYAAGGNPRLLRGPGDGMSDNIPATISGRQPARLADGEFVIPADVVSHLGNGSTEAGAKQLHAMMDKVRKARTGNSKQGKNIKPQKYMPK